MADSPEQDALLQAALLKADDVSKMSADERRAYEEHLCKEIGLNPLTRPFIYLPDREKKYKPYLKKEAKEQIRKKHRISTVITERVILGDIYMVSVRASTPDGRVEDSIGAVSLTKPKKVQKGTWPKSNDPKWVDVLDEDGDKVLIPLKGEERANAMMRAATKATSRATLAISGAGFSEAYADEDDVEPIVTEPFTGTGPEAVANIFGDDLPPREELRLNEKEKAFLDATDESPLPPEVQDSGREATPEEIASIFIEELEAAHAKAQNKYDFEYSLDGIKTYIEILYDKPLADIGAKAQAHIIGWFEDRKSLVWLSGELKKNQVAIKRKLPPRASANVRPQEKELAAAETKEPLPY